MVIRNLKPARIVHKYRCTIAAGFFIYLKCEGELTMRPVHSADIRKKYSWRVIKRIIRLFFFWKTRKRMLRISWLALLNKGASRKNHYIPYIVNRQKDFPVSVLIGKRRCSGYLRRRSLTEE